MYWYQYLSLTCFVACFVACLWHFFRLIRLGKPKDLSKKSGDIVKAEVYSYTIAMLPNKKESACLHIPTFTSGIMYHCGTFLSLTLFVVFFFVIPEMFISWFTWVFVVVLTIGSICGLGLFIKRIISKKLRRLSHLDDFISNALPTIFQIMTILYLMFRYPVASYYYIAASLLFLYIPVGKLRHVVYFFAARYHLGFFYGWRNTWPPMKK